MKSPFLTVTLLLAATAPAWSQASPTPKPVTTVPIRPNGQTPVDVVKALPLVERVAIQGDLAWLGKYNGLVTGEINERVINAIRAYQKDVGNAAPSGTLDAKERASLAEAAKKAREAVGWRVAQDPINGVKLGIPTKLVPKMSAMSDTTGSRWSSLKDGIQIDTWREGSPTLAEIAERERKRGDRKITYSTVKPDMFILSGTQDDKKFYMRAQISSNEVRGMTIQYDQANEKAMEPIVIVMSSAFEPFPKSVVSDAPPPRKKVEYATGIVVSSDGSIVTDRYTIEGCQSVVIPGHGNADRIAEDKADDLALLRIYGASGLKPLKIAPSAVRPDVMLIGIADPQAQGGGAAVSNVAATVTGAGTAATLSPVPGLGFSGAAAVDANGQFAGLSQLRPAVVAGPAPATAQAKLASAEAVSRFLASNKIEPATDTSGARSAVVRIICIRK